MACVRSAIGRIWNAMSMYELDIVDIVVAKGDLAQNPQLFIEAISPAFSGW